MIGQGAATGEKNGGRHMYYATSLGRKRIIHTPDCPHCKRIREENLIEIPSIWAAFSKRYHLCKHCNPLMQKYKSEESAIQEYCSHNGLCFSVENKCFRVETPRSLWKITLEDNATYTTLYHKNELHLEKRRHDRVSGVYSGARLLPNAQPDPPCTEEERAASKGNQTLSQTAEAGQKAGAPRIHTQRAKFN